MQWTLRDGLIAYAEILKDDAHAQYRNEYLIWATLAPHYKKTPAAPSLPPILR
jgi:hypothetical protein